MDGITAVLAGAAAAVGAGLYYGTKRVVDKSKVRLVAAPLSGDKSDGCVRAIIEANCPSLVDPSQARLVPTPYLLNGMVHTIYCSTVALKKDSSSNIKYEREMRIMSDKGTVSLDWYPGRGGDSESTTPVVIVVTGLGGSSYEYHVRSLAKYLATKTNSKMRVVVANHRGCGRTPLTSSRLYNAYDTSDLADVVDYIAQCFPKAPIGCVGYSMGANLLVRYLGERGDNTPLTAAVGVSSPFDASLTGRSMSKPGFLNDNVFQPAVMSTLKRTVMRNLDMIQSGTIKYDIDAIMKAKRVSELDNELTAKTYGFKDCWEYYAAGSTIESVDNIKRPFLDISACDDPITPAAGIPLARIEKNPYTAVALVEYGGHIGFFTGLSPRIWVLKPIAEFLDAALVKSAE
ncbi:hypothetical protein LPJ61_002386 [Coemansia biformis]|uniref:AB hydrolase-1 domain-containing protein n=1 Tax=Coemansia biformis TaxID=1286918 RepID=A0A9W7YEW7_9FUNG|nr:hypothetical protein LPJ61_002386 [Coemansia biformis]